MSIADVGLDRTDAQERGDSFSLWDMPFSRWLPLQLTTSPLYPNRYQLRPIEDKGSISDSLAAASIDLFDRAPTEENFLIRAGKAVALFALSAFVAPAFAALGVCYHGAMTIKRLVVWIPSKGEEAERSWEKLKQSGARLGQDAGIALVSLVATAVAPAIGPNILILSTIFFGNLPFSSTFLSIDLAGSRSNDQLYGFYKSLLLRREFGIVDAANRKFLTWDPIKDRDLRYNLQTYELVGYFGRLHANQGLEFLDRVKEMKKKLPDSVPFPFTYPPKADRIIAFFEKSQVLSPSEIEEWKRGLKTLEENMKLTRHLILKSFRLVQQSNIYGNYLKMEFPLFEPYCREYLGL